jgi:hypothetical protein
MSRIPEIWHRSVLIAATTVAILGCATAPQRSPLVEDPNSHPWREDLAIFAGELEREHKDLFFQLPREEFAEMVRELSAQAPTLSAIEFDLELRRILAAVGDSHTMMSYPFDPLLPLAFYQFEEGIYCMGAVPAYADALSARLIAIDGSPVDAVTAVAREITPHDNDSQIAMMVPMYLMMPEILFGTGIIRSPERAEFTFRDEQGTTFSVPVQAASQERAREIELLKNRLQEVGVPQPLSRRNNSRAYWYTFDQERGLMYVQYNVCREDPEYPMSEFAEDVLSRIDGGTPDQVVIDLRRNSGGDSRVLQPLIDGLVSRHRSGAAYRLSVVIGRDTFSSAVLNAIALKQEAGAIFVGEPSGGRPNHYGEIRTFELPNLGRTVQYSTKYFDHYDAADGGDPSALMPDIPAPPSFPAYVQGRDPVMDRLGLGHGAP